MKASFISLILLVPCLCNGISRPEKEFPIYQFPHHQIPRIDGVFTDWEQVPESYSIGLDELKDTVRNIGKRLDPADFDLSVKVAWVKGLNRLYFYYEATDDYWDFKRPGLQNDIFELVVDADLSGGTFIKKKSGNINLLPATELHFKGHGAHAQNYHIFTPAMDKSWAMIWGSTPWLKEFPYALSAQEFSFEHGGTGRLRMEFYISPYDHADHRGPEFSVPSNLQENELIGLSWCILDYDNESPTFESFMNLSHHTEMIRNGSHLCAFRLMPLESSLLPKLAAYWSFSIMPENPRKIQFLDKSTGNISNWQWDFGDGTSSQEQNPVHLYESAGEWVVTLTVSGPDGEDSFSRIWDIVTP